MCARGRCSSEWLDCIVCAHSIIIIGDTSNNKSTITVIELQIGNIEMCRGVTEWKEKWDELSLFRSLVGFDGGALYKWSNKLLNMVRYWFPYFMLRPFLTLVFSSSLFASSSLHHELQNIKSFPLPFLHHCSLSMRCRRPSNTNFLLLTNCELLE